MTRLPDHEQLALEAETWNRAAEPQAGSLPPDWRDHRHLLPNAVLHRPHVEELLARIDPGMRVLEVGCGLGWLALEMARRGASVVGVDVADRAISLARAYAAACEPGVAERLSYRVADLTRAPIPEGRFDLVVAKGILHHLTDPADLIDRIHDGLLAGGLLWVSDTFSDETLITAGFAGLLLMVLPTHLSYREKLQGLFRSGWQAPSRVRASMQAEGLSPFEGAGRQPAWLSRIYQRFVVERRIDHPAVTGYLAHQIALPDRPAVAVLSAIRTVDSALVRLGLLRSSSVTLIARKSFGASAGG